MTSERCDHCGVLPGRDHHYDCQSSEAKRIRREWAEEERVAASPRKPSCRRCQRRFAT